MKKRKKKVKRDIGQEIIDGLTEARDALRANARIDACEFKRDLGRRADNARTRPEDEPPLAEVLKGLRKKLAVNRRNLSGG